MQGSRTYPHPLSKAGGHAIKNMQLKNRQKLFFCRFRFTLELFPLPESRIFKYFADVFKKSLIRFLFCILTVDANCCMKKFSAAPRTNDKNCSRHAKSSVVKRKIPSYIENTMRTSYSAIDTYLQCPQRYKFQEIDCIRVPKSREALFGTLVHETLVYMFRHDPLFPTLEEVTGYFREHWPSAEEFNTESAHDPLKRPWSDEEIKRYYEEGVRMLKNFYEKNAPWNLTVIDLESRFEVVLADEKTGETHILAGIMDRIDKTPDGIYEIIDYKTGRRMPSQDSINDNLQLSLYSLGLQKRWPHIKPEEISLSLYFLRHGEKLTTKATAEMTEKTKNHALATIQEIQTHIRSGKTFEPMPGPLCDWCNFRPLCPAWKHLYKNQKSNIKNQNELDEAIKEFFVLKKEVKEKDARLGELENKIKTFMDAEGLTRVFGDEGIIAKRTQQRFAYDMEKVRLLLSPLGKWDEVLKVDETKLKKILLEIPEHLRREIESSRAITKEYTVLRSVGFEHKLK